MDKLGAKVDDFDFGHTAADAGSLGGFHATDAI
jgi:hypothetical protein